MCVFCRCFYHYLWGKKNSFLKCLFIQSSEIHCINETCRYLQCLVHELAIKLKTTAVCTAIRRLRYGYFDLQRALVHQQWHLDQIIDNIESNMDLLTPDRIFVGTQAEKVKLIPPDHSAGHLSEGQHMIEQDHDLFENSALTTDAETVIESGSSECNKQSANSSER